MAHQRTGPRAGAASARAHGPTWCREPSDRPARLAACPPSPSSRCPSIEPSVSPTGSSSASRSCSGGRRTTSSSPSSRVLWSEHCGYKHSARLLKRLPSQGERVLQGPGENAGVIDLGDGVAVAFKVESHNHPSAVEPFQGAATGVGGIIRDIVAMGARPIALLDGLRFGAPDWHFRRAVAGIGHYGNCTGIPNVGGETVFDEAYAANPLVNAMCVGLLPTERVLQAKATGTGQPARALRRAHRPRRDRRRVRAREPGSRGLRREAAVGPDRRPVPRQGADRGVARPRRARPRARPAGLRRRGARVVARRDGARRRGRRRPPRPRAAARARPRAVGDHDLRVAGADGRGRRARAARRGRGGLRALGAAVHGDRRGHGPRRAARLLPRRASSARSRPACSPTSARATRSSRRPARADARAAACTRPATSRRRGCSSSTTSSSARAPCAGRASTRPCCGSTACAGSPSRSTGRRSASATRSAPAGRR